jgi:hypothetical protein
MRAYTEPLRNINRLEKDWLDSHENRIFREFPELGEWLERLNDHLLAWEALYQATVAKDERRALVYLGDEYKWGQRFPTGIEEVVNRTIKNYDEYRGKLTESTDQHP